MKNHLQDMGAEWYTSRRWEGWREWFPEPAEKNSTERAA